MKVEEDMHVHDVNATINDLAHGDPFYLGTPAVAHILTNEAPSGADFYATRFADGARIGINNGAAVVRAALHVVPCGCE